MLVSVYKQRFLTLRRRTNFRKRITSLGGGNSFIILQSIYFAYKFVPVKYPLQTAGVVFGKLFEWFYKIS